MKAFSKQTIDLEKSVEASYRVSLAIAKAKKPHTIAENLIKPCCVEMISLLCDDQEATKIKNVSVSNDTVKKRIDEMSLDCKV